MPDPSWVPPQQFDNRIDAGFYTPDHLHNEVVLRASPYGADHLGHYLQKVFKGAFFILASEYRDSGVPFLRVTDITQGFVDTSQCVFLPREIHQREKKTAVTPGCLLFAKGGSIGNSAVVPEFLQEANISQDLIGAILRNSLDPYYACAFLVSTLGVSQMIRWAQGNVHPHITNDSVKAILIPRAEKSIQTAIGNKLRKAERLRQHAEKEKVALDEGFLSLLGTPSTENKGRLAYWITDSLLSTYRLNPTEYHPYLLDVERVVAAHFAGCPLVEALVDPDDISGGATPDGARYVSQGVGFLRVQNIAANRLDRRDLVYIDNDTNRFLNRSQIRANDVVMTITGNPGVACCIQERHLPLNMNQHSVRFQVNSNWNPFFAAAFLNTEWGKAQAARRSIGGTREALDYPSVQSIVLPNVPRQTQDALGQHAKEYADALDAADALAYEATGDVDKLILGRLDVKNIIAEGEEITRWLAQNKPTGETRSSR